MQSGAERTEKGATPDAVQRRRMFYIPGYDPFPPRRYRELYRKESAAQAQISGYDLTLTARTSGQNGYGWAADATIGAQQTHTEIDVLVWADLVQASMSRGVLRTYGLLVKTLWFFLASGAFVALLRLRPQPMIAASWPVVVLLGQLIVAGVLGWGVGAGAAWLVSQVIAPPFCALIGWAVGLGLVALLLQQFRKWDSKLYAYYLLYDFAHTASHKGAYGAELQIRLARFTDQIYEALLDPTLDEVLVVGHSSGASLAVSVVADLLTKKGGSTPGKPVLGLLTLGQAIPVQSYLPKADKLRGDIARLSVSDALTWVDVSAQGDGCCFGLCDPVAVSGVAPEDQRWPLVLSAAFSLSLKPATWRKLRWRFFRAHFQYLAAFDNPRDYDYFQITAGPMTLADRYRGRKNSPSRVTRALSPYRSVE